MPQTHKSSRQHGIWKEKLAEDDMVTPTRRSWEAFLQALAHAVALNNSQPADSVEFLRRAIYYVETHPLSDPYEQDDVRATLAKFAQFVEQMPE